MTPETLEYLSFDLPDSTCPTCYKTLNYASSFTKPGQGPQPGHMGLCLKCGTFVTYLDNMHTRLATQDEIDEATDAVKSIAAGISKAYGGAAS